MGACEGVTARPVIDDGGTVVGVDLSLEIGHAAGSAALEPVFEAEGADELSVFDPQLGREVGLDDLSEMDQCFARSAAYLAALGHPSGQVDGVGQHASSSSRFTMGIWVVVALVCALAMIMGQMSRCLF